MAMSWIDIIVHVYKDREDQELPDSPIFSSPASNDEFEEAENTLGIEFPNELKSLLYESNGVMEQMRVKQEEIVTGYLIWPIKMIIETNMEFRSGIYDAIYKPFDSLLFFADAGNGDQFAYTIDNHSITQTDIYAWNHESDLRKLVAPSLKFFIEERFSGKIGV